MSQTLLANWNILQNSNIFYRSRETVLVMSFGGEKVTQFSGFPPTLVSYLNGMFYSRCLDVHSNEKIIISKLALSE